MCPFPTRRFCLAIAFVAFASSQADGAEKLEYKLHAGQVFAYDVEIKWTESGEQHRLSGQPFYQVHHTDDSKAVMMVVGRLRYAANDGTGWKPNASHDYWFGSDLTIDHRADFVNGMSGKGAAMCPIRVASYMDDLIFPELPPTQSGKLTAGEPTSFVEVGSIPLAASRRRRGQKYRQTKANPLGPGLVQLDTTKGHHTEDGHLRHTYRARATFDIQIGALLKHKVILKEDNLGYKYEVLISANRIRSNERLAAAQSQANRDYAQIPAKMMPV